LARRHKGFCRPSNINLGRLLSAALLVAGEVKLKVSGRPRGLGWEQVHGPGVLDAETGGNRDLKPLSQKRWRLASMALCWTALPCSMPRRVSQA
jgi:hypothetical protein